VALCRIRRWSGTERKVETEDKKQGKKERRKYTITNENVPTRLCKYSGYMMEVTEWALSDL
jgi:hypothetical protein